MIKVWKPIIDSKIVNAFPLRAHIFIIVLEVLAIAIWHGNKKERSETVTIYKCDFYIRMLLDSKESKKQLLH